MAAGLSEAEAAEKPFIASMGIYVFRKDVLIKLLKSSFPKVLSSSSNSVGPDQATLIEALNPENPTGPYERALK